MFAAPARGITAKPLSLHCIFKSLFILVLFLILNLLNSIIPIIVTYDHIHNNLILFPLLFIVVYVNYDIDHH